MLKMMVVIILVSFLFIMSCDEATGPSALLPAGMEFVTIPSGSFLMGSPESLPYSPDCERPVHTVTFSYSFEMMTTEVTEGMWEEVMGVNPVPIPKGSDHPACYVSWIYSQEFIAMLNNLDPNHTYRLPSEAEWEYACRAGTTTAYYWGDDPEGTEGSQYAYFYSTCRVMPVASLLPNAWGLYDMSGNVNEWCQDSWHDDYNGAPTDGSAWELPSDSSCVSRGGNASSAQFLVRSAVRGSDSITHGSCYAGLRLVRTELS